ncbi:MAG TPA: flagellar hook capping FlgD N-terminal domain-containing protein [Microvirga sp.]|jgi:flagellar basal-body rod modification protein FlgD|nr:flagellar hook capping FlgD N-terminal domain-containing protein [Microvirga sp.]
MAAGIGRAGAATSAGSGVDRQTIAQNFDAFLLLLTTQLQNQNPLEPLDTNQFTQQLVQFASVEQQMKSNDTLKALLTSSQSSIVASAASFVGMTVTADGATTYLKGGKAEWNLTLPRAGTATITIRDANGSIVKEDSRSYATAGTETYAWDGKTSTGLPAADGAYTITVTGKDVSGQPFTVKTEVNGKVDSVDMSGEEPVLLIGSTRILLRNVKNLSRPAGA